MPHKKPALARQSDGKANQVKLDASGPLVMIELSGLSVIELKRSADGLVPHLEQAQHGTGELVADNRLPTGCKRPATLQIISKVNASQGLGYYSTFCPSHLFGRVTVA